MNIHEPRDQKILHEDRSQGREEVQAHNHARAAGDDAGFTEEEKTRFWSKVDKEGPLPDQSNPHYAGLDRCWVWTGGRFHYGHGVFAHKGKPRKANRISHAIHFGPIPTGMCALHKCDNPPCVNPSHLFLGTNLDNLKDRDAKGRQAKGDTSGPRKYPEKYKWGDDHSLRTHPELRAFGERNGHATRPEKTPRGEGHKMAKLTTDQVLMIRASTKHKKELAAELGVTHQLIHAVRMRRIWKHVPEAK